MSRARRAHRARLARVAGLAVMCLPGAPRTVRANAWTQLGEAAARLPGDVGKALELVRGIQGGQGPLAILEVDVVEIQHSRGLVNKTRWLLPRIEAAVHAGPCRVTREEKRTHAQLLDLEDILLMSAIIAGLDKHAAPSQRFVRAAIALSGVVGRCQDASLLTVVSANMMAEHTVQALEWLRNSELIDAATVHRVLREAAPHWPPPSAMGTALDLEQRRLIDSFKEVDKDFVGIAEPRAIYDGEKTRAAIQAHFAALRRLLSEPPDTVRRQMAGQIKPQDPREIPRLSALAELFVDGPKTVLATLTPAQYKLLQTQDNLVGRFLVASYVEDIVAVVGRGLQSMESLEKKRKELLKSK